MIHYLATSEHTYTVSKFLDSWAPALAANMEILCYERLHEERRMEPGTYIFADLERLSPAQHRAAVRLWERLERRDDVRLLNDPRRVLLRYELLRTMHRAGINRFNVHRLSERGHRWQPPVFLRYENDHAGARTPLLFSRAAFWSAALRLAARDLGRTLVRRQRSRRILVEEFCDTSDAQGVFRLYSAFCIAGTILPRTILFSRNWVTKFRDIQGSGLVREKEEFLAENPHEQALRGIFHAAHIDYGRIDYGLSDGRVQVWEINTNPTVMARPPRDFEAGDRRCQEEFARAYFDAIQALDPHQAMPCPMHA